eukprot:1178272-Prorocentrum_minimum.AAC.3
MAKSVAFTSEHKSTTKTLVDAQFASSKLPSKVPVRLPGGGYPTCPEIGEGIKALPLWKPNEQQTKISRTFVAKNFVAENLCIINGSQASLGHVSWLRKESESLVGFTAINFFNSAAEVAESEGHHPDLHLTNYRRWAASI